jgi:SAM-dependent methyltransferase
MHSTDFRDSPGERSRISDLLRLMPAQGRRALDVGARDGYISRLMADRFDAVTALDLVEPTVSHPKVRCLQADATCMPLPDAAFDLVLCAEVLEHIPGAMLPQVCREIERVAATHVLIGVPYKQDLRVGRTTCAACGAKNPPWGHVNTFDEERLRALFMGCEVVAISYVGHSLEQTNAFAAALMDFAGNPYGTYVQDEGCIACGASVGSPRQRTPAQRVATRVAHLSRKVTDVFTRPRANWMHMKLRKRAKTRSA